MNQQWESEHKRSPIFLHPGDKPMRAKMTPANMSSRAPSRKGFLLSWKAFTLVEIIFVSAIMAILTVIVFRTINSSRTIAQRNACIANLKQIADAKELALMDGIQPTMNNLVPIYITTPACPAGGDYTVGPGGTLPSCSLSASDGHQLTS